MSAFALFRRRRGRCNGGASAAPVRILAPGVFPTLSEAIQAARDAASGLCENVAVVEVVEASRYVGRSWEDLRPEVMVRPFGSAEVASRGLLLLLDEMKETAR